MRKGAEALTRPPRAQEHVRDALGTDSAKSWWVTKVVGRRFGMIIRNQQITQINQSRPAFDEGSRFKMQIYLQIHFIGDIASKSREICDYQRKNEARDVSRFREK